MGYLLLTRAGVVLAVALVLGCGYRPVGATLVLGPDVQQLEIRMFENPTDEPGLEQVLGEALMEEFMRGGRLRAVPAGGSGGSQAVLRGVIQRVYVRPNSFSSVAISVEDSLEVTVNASVLRVDTGETLWEGFGLSARQNFLSSADPLVYESNKQMAMLRVATLIAEDIHNDLFSY